MKLSKRVLSVLMALLMVFTVFQMSISAIDIAAGDNDENTKVMVDNGEGRYVLPDATLTATPVIRTAGKADGVGDYIVGNTIVQATASGVPYTSGNYANEAYSGESPEWPTVTFECDLSLANDKGSVSLETNISGANIEVSNPTNNKWVWTIKGGTISAGTYADFTVSYSYTHKDQLTGVTETKNYKAYASSYVDYVLQPAGMYLSSDRTWAFHSRNKCEAVDRILGHNTKGSYYNNAAGNAGDSGSDEWAHGVYDFQTRSAIGWGNKASAYPNGGTVLYKSEKKGEGSINTNTSLDRQRPVSSTYIDTSKGKALNSADINLRYSVYFFGEHSEEYNAFLNGIIVKSGEKTYDKGDSSDVTAVSELDFALAGGDSSYAYTCTGKEDPVIYNTSNPYAIFNSANSGKVLALNVPFRGTSYTNSAEPDTVNNDGNKVVKYTFVSAPAQRYYATDSGQVLNIYNGINIYLYMYDKANLRGAIEEATDNDTQIPVSPTGTQRGAEPQAWYYDNTDGSYDAYLTALKNAQHINAKYDTNQNDINAAADALDAAAANLKVATADYSATEAAMARYRDLEAGDYTTDSWRKLQEAKAALGDMDFTVFYQPFVNDLTAKFIAAMDALEEGPADFTRVDEALTAAAEITDFTPYTDASVAAFQALLDEAVSDEFRDKKHSDQAYVDSIADAIYDMLEATPGPGGLEYKLADYTEVDALIAEYDARTDSAMYTDASWGAYTGAVESVTHGMLANQQWLVDEMRDDIITARDNLTLKDADYTAVNAAKADANALNKNNYTADSWANLQAAIKAVKTGLKIDKQAQVDGYAQAIRDAIDALVIAAGDYTAVDAAIDEYDALNKSWYKQDGIEAVDAAIAAVVRGYNKTRQSEIDAMAAAINEAIDALEMKDADYTQANIQIARYNALDSSLYTTSSYRAATTANTNLGKKMNLKIDQQATVDSLTAALKDAIDNLQYKPGNYAEVNAAKSNANALLDAAEDYAKDYNGNPYYTEDSVAALQAAIDAVVTGLTIDKQAQIDGYAQAIRDAIAALENNTADYTAVNAAVDSIPEDLESGRYDDAKVAAVVNAFDAIEYGLLTDEQDTVDGYAAALDAAVKALTLKGADYSGVEAAIASKPADLTPYTFESVENLNSKINAVVYGLSIDDQATVDAYAAAILKAIDDLELDMADYTKVEEAKTAANDALTGEDKDNYTDASKQAVTDAVDAVVYNLPASQQSTVDGYAKAINDAVEALEYKPADYTAVDAAKAAADEKAAEKDLYKNFDAVEAAVAAVVEGKNIKEQAAVDAMADAINDAIAALEYKDIDTTAYDAKVAEFNALDKAIYTDDSVAAVEAAITAGDNFLAQDGLTIKDQADLDALTADLAEAIDALELKKADYTALNAKIEEFYTKDEDLYTNYFDQWMIVSDVESWLAENGDLLLADQALVDEQTAIVAKAIADLELALADYTELNAKIEEFYTYNEDDYTNYFDQWMVVSDVESWLAENGDLLLADQALVDEQTAIVAQAIADLELALADYTELNAKIAEFYTYPEDEYTNYFDEWMIVSDVESWLAENGNLPEKDQGLVDEQTAIVAKAIADLEPIATEPTAYFQAKEGSTTVINTKTMTITGLKTDLNNKELLTEFLDYDGVTVKAQKANSSAKYLGTGSTVTVTWADGKVDVYTIIIYGDVDGNGLVDGTDVATTSSYVAGITTLTSIQQRAANVDGMRNVLSTDAVAIQEVVSSGKSFDQVNPVIING